MNEDVVVKEMRRNLLTGKIINKKWDLKNLRDQYNAKRHDLETLTQDIMTETGNLTDLEAELKKME
jgi:hypothetical protein